jgi:hypothetical protein
MIEMDQKTHDEIGREQPKWDDLNFQAIVSRRAYRIRWPACSIPGEHL